MTLLIETQFHKGSVPICQALRDYADNDPQDDDAAVLQAAAQYIMELETTLASIKVQALQIYDKTMERKG